MAAIVTLSLELIIFWNCKFVVRGSTEVCDKRSDLGTLQAIAIP